MRLEDRPLLPVGDGVVTQLQIDFGFGVTVDSWLRSRIERRFGVERIGMANCYDPERRGSVGPLADLHQAVISEVTVLFDGGLRAAFVRETILSVLPSEKYEAFSVIGPGAGIETFGSYRCRAAAWRNGSPSLHQSYRFEASASERAAAVTLAFRPEHASAEDRPRRPLVARVAIPAQTASSTLVLRPSQSGAPAGARHPTLLAVCVRFPRLPESFRRRRGSVRSGGCR